MYSMRSKYSSVAGFSKSLTGASMKFFTKRMSPISSFFVKDFTLLTFLSEREFSFIANHLDGSNLLWLFVSAVAKPVF